MGTKQGFEFIKAVKHYMTHRHGFDKCLRKITILAGGEGMCRAEFIVSQEHLNHGGGLHGAFTATIVDVISTYGLMSYQNIPPGVSVDLHVSYLKSAREGDHIIIDASTIKTGKTLAFLECLLTNGSTGKIVAKDILMGTKPGLEFVKAVANYMVRGQGFDGCLKQLKITAGGEGMCRAEFKVGPEHLNQGGGLHGGFTATVVDVVTTYGLMSLQNVPPGVSVDLHVSYMKGAKEGDQVIVEANTIKTGKNLAYLECILKHATDGSIIAKGTQTKYVGPPLKVPDYS